MKKTTLACALLLALSVVAVPAQADNFLVSLLASAKWQPPKCKAPEVLTQVKDNKGNIRFVCAVPKASQ